MTNLEEPRLTIGGKLTAGDAVAAFANLNPATEEVLGHTYDATAEDMSRAIAAARTAFDDTNWSTDRTFRKRCLQQLQDALERERETLREVLISEAGCPVLTTRSLQLDSTLVDDLRWPIDHIET